jgi:hypothetical protein
MLVVAGKICYISQTIRNSKGTYRGNVRIWTWFLKEGAENRVFGIKRKEETEKFVKGGQ